MRLTLQTQKLFLALTLAAYIFLAVFGVLALGHTHQGQTMPECPYAQNGFAVCANSLDHINNWRQFSNVTFPSIFVFSILILGIILYFLDRRNLLNHKQYFYKWKYYLDNEKFYNPLGEIIKWLALFENSPPVPA